MRLDMDALPAMISQAMQRQDLSVREAARRSDVSFANLSAVLYGRSKRPSPELLQGIANGLGIPYRDLALAAYGILPTPSREGALVPA